MTSYVFWLTLICAGLVKCLSLGKSSSLPLHCLFKHTCIWAQKSTHEEKRWRLNQCTWQNLDGGWTKNKTGVYTCKNDAEPFSCAWVRIKCRCLYYLYFSISLRAPNTWGVTAELLQQTAVFDKGDNMWFSNRGERKTWFLFMKKI